ncbi:putative ABC transport system permease protein [Marivirga sericea]|uniref:Putative ABC transport system permease protein n=1 Tax=Marivirga sericea TaxID=1028 RepID=A0A1X7I338_9BACT|nr:FtsX-like permease family protein [Marivirga sericea]SMG08112.1 putative ABC transport system permease protein [Marivirga sericea]
MLKNYIKIAFRNLIKHKLYTGINVIGLSLGLGISILLFIFIQDEFSFDKFHERGDQIARVLWEEEVQPGEVSLSASAPMAAPNAIKSSFEEVVGTSHVISTSNLTKTEGENALLQQTTIVGPDFLKMFSFPVLKGSENPLEDKYSVAITESTAKKFFGRENPLGRSLLIQLGKTYEAYEVKAVLADPPVNSSINFGLLISDQNLSTYIGQQGLESWFNNYGESYVWLKEGYSLKSLEEKFPNMIISGIGQEQYDEATYALYLQPIKEAHLNPDISGGSMAVTDPQLLWILFSVALMIMLIACINFTTLAIGRSATRAKEVGVRKTMGAAYKQLFGQFMTESLILTIVSTLLGTLIAQLLLPVFNDLFEKSLVISYSLTQVSIILGLMLLITIVAGSYPALFLSNLKPIQVLKGRMSVNFGKHNLRKTLVGVQFFISLFLVACTLIMYQQMKKINTYDLGFSSDNILEVKVPLVSSGGGFGSGIKMSFEKANRYKQAIKKREGIANAGIAMSTYGNNSWWNAGFPQDDGTTFYYRFNIIDTDYANVLGYEFKEGRNLSTEFPSDSTAFIINETFARAAKMESPLQAQVGSPGSYDDHRIVGVVKDFHHAALYSEIEPVMMAMSPDVGLSGINTLNIPGGMSPTVFVKAGSNDYEEVLSSLKDEWVNLFPDEPFDYKFFDESIQQQYEADQRLGKMIAMAAIIAIIIASMGLFALASLAITGRLKEIGIRKVMGASPANISLMFNKEFLKITTIGIVLALPVSYWLMSKWLDQFEVKAVPGLGVLITTVLLGLIFTITIVSFQTIKASYMNPVKSLKEE